MKIQSLSIAVPAKDCINHCKFCVSRMHCNQYANRIENVPYFKTSVDMYLSRLNYARELGCNTVILTGTAEPQQNREFLRTLGFLFRMMDNPFEKIEIQTTGVLLDIDYLYFLRDWVGVSLIALSVASFNQDQNNSIIGTPKNHPICLPLLTDAIKDLGMNLRLCLNLTDAFGGETPSTLVDHALAYEADQLTFRKMYADDDGSPQSNWVLQNTQKFDYEKFDFLFRNHTPKTYLRTLPYGQNVYDIQGVSVIYDDDCMAKNPQSDDLKYLVLRPDCRLYSSWDSKASLIF